MGAYLGGLIWVYTLLLSPVLAGYMYTFVLRVLVGTEKYRIGADGLNLCEAGSMIYCSWWIVQSELRN